MRKRFHAFALLLNFFTSYHPLPMDISSISGGDGHHLEEEHRPPGRKKAKANYFYIPLTKKDPLEKPLLKKTPRNQDYLRFCKKENHRFGVRKTGRTHKGRHGSVRKNTSPRKREGRSIKK